MPSDFSLQHWQAFFNSGSWLSWVAALALSLILSFLVKLFLNASCVRLKRTRLITLDPWKSHLVDSINATRGWVIFIWIFSGFLLMIDGGGRSEKLMRIVLSAATCYQLALWAIRAADNWRERSLARAKTQDLSSVGAIGLMASVAKGILIAIIALLGLSNAGVDVAALVASFGIGGLAVALASRNILEDLLASVSILLDKPFEVNDFIVVGDKLGAVETIGIKTTRIRALSGEQVIFSNKDLLGSRIQNFKRMWQRRVQLRFSVPYGTPVDKLEQIPGWITELVKAEPKLRLDRCHLAGFGTYSIDFELVFFVLDPDYNLFMDTQQRLLLALHRRFDAEGVQFAVPVQKLTLESSSRPLDPVDRTFNSSEIQGH